MLTAECRKLDLQDFKYSWLVLVPPHDAGALAAAVLALHDDPERRLEMGRKSLQLSESFSVQRWVNDTLKLYYRLTGAPITVDEPSFFRDASVSEC